MRLTLSYVSKRPSTIEPVRNYELKKLEKQSPRRVLQKTCS